MNKFNYTRKELQTINQKMAVDYMEEMQNTIKSLVQQLEYAIFPKENK